MEVFESNGKKIQKAKEKKSADQSAENRDSNLVNLNMERLVKDMGSVHLGSKGTVCEADTEEDYGAVGYDYGSDFSYHDFTRVDPFMDGDDMYSDALYEQLKFATLMKNFVRANEQSSKKDNEGTSKVEEESEDEFTPAEIKSLLDSFSSQQGLPGSASALLGLIGLQPRKDDIVRSSAPAETQGRGPHKFKKKARLHRQAHKGK
ncbi:hypothetical protein BVC80_9075g108 [Macleaya cordata]|uniref:Uncharacterized protein n=1 Tax=Macleaya cordata TaxID=56857 RepID=A0A200PUG8_MACCD|nr:hypothetical protein BVC80_9075g108 [Macleaya cordata]